MTSTTIIQSMRVKYPSALYAHFRITNLREAYEKFQRDQSVPPAFQYKDTLSSVYCQRRISSLKKELQQISSQEVEAIQFLRRRLLETEVLEQFCKSYENPGRVAGGRKAQFHERQIDLYGALDKDVFMGVLRYLEQRCSKQNEPHLKAIRRQVNFKQFPDLTDLYRPSPATFAHYRQLYPLTFPELWDFLNQVAHTAKFEPADTRPLFDEALMIVGASSDGWEVRKSLRGGNLMVAKQKRIIIIPKDFEPRSALRLAQIIAHEVGCHVLFAMHRPNGGLEESYVPEEGLAIVLEQLIAPRFYYKRAMRYFAVCLAAGIDGVERDFIEVFRILREAFIVVADKDILADEKAFYETARIFRGGIPSIKGMCYIKDKVYLEQNLEAWKILETKLLNVEEFRALFTNHERTKA